MYRHTESHTVLFGVYTNSDVHIYPGSFSNGNKLEIYAHGDNKEDCLVKLRSLVKDLQEALEKEE